MVDNCSFENIIAENYVGAIVVLGDDCQISNSSFINNTAEYGGAIFWQGDNGIVYNSLFEDNRASVSGGAIYWAGDSGNIIWAKFMNNSPNNVYPRDVNIINVFQFLFRV